ncbi:hypothetical protein ACS0TY_020659 [Phlomoides rotata]
MVKLTMIARVTDGLPLAGGLDDGRDVPDSDFYKQQENPARANCQIFNVGNPNNEVTVRQLAETMTQVYTKVSGEPVLETPTIDISFKEFYGEGYDDSDKRIPDMTIINKQLGWHPKTSVWDLLESTLTYQHRTYAEAVKKATSRIIKKKLIWRIRLWTRARDNY